MSKEIKKEEISKYFSEMKKNYWKTLSPEEKSRRLSLNRRKGILKKKLYAKQSQEKS